MDQTVSYTHLDVYKRQEKLHATEYSVIPDQIEAGTFMFAVAAAGGNVLVKNVIPDVYKRQRYLMTGEWALAIGHRI